MKKFILLLIFCFLIVHVNVFVASAAIDAAFTPLFETISIYAPYEFSGAVCNVSYKKKNGIVADCLTIYSKNGSWEEAFPLEYNARDKKFSGFIGNLKEDTEYDIKIEIKSNGTIVQSDIKTVKTLKSNVPIGREVNLSDVMGMLTIDSSYNGTENGWTRIKGGSVTANNTTNQQAVLFTGCEYIIFEGVTVKGGSKDCIRIANASKHIRIINCDISGWGKNAVLTSPAGSYTAGYVDSDGNRVNNAAGIHIADTGNILIEKNYIHDSITKTNPWADTDDVYIVSKGKTEPFTWSNQHPGGPCGIYVRGKGGIVIRYNDIVGSEDYRFNDAIESYQNGQASGGLYKDADVYGNILAFTQDDAIELDGGAENIRFFKNKIEHTYCGISTAPIITGPAYIYNNLIHNLEDNTGAVGSGMKNGGAATLGTNGKFFVFYNTFYTKSGFTESAFGIHDVGYNGDAKFRTMTRNNIFHLAGKNRTAIDVVDNLNTDTLACDYDLAYDETSSKTKSALFNLPDGSLQETNGIVANPLFAGEAAADYRLNANSPASLSATPIKGFAGRNMGAFDNKSSGLLPYRPIKMTADKYLVTIPKNGSATVTITSTESSNTPFKILKSSDFNCVVFSQTTGTIPAGGSITLTLTSQGVPYDKYDGIFIVKLSNGYSIPISVRAMK